MTASFLIHNKAIIDMLILFRTRFIRMYKVTKLGYVGRVVFLGKKRRDIHVLTKKQPKVAFKTQASSKLLIPVLAIHHAY